MAIIINVSAFRFFHTQTSYYLAVFVCTFQKTVLFLKTVSLTKWSVFVEMQTHSSPSSNPSFPPGNSCKHIFFISFQIIFSCPAQRHEQSQWKSIQIFAFNLFSLSAKKENRKNISGSEAENPIAVISTEKYLCFIVCCILCCFTCNTPSTSQVHEHYCLKIPHTSLTKQACFLCSNAWHSLLNHHVGILAHASPLKLMCHYWMSR